MDSFPRILVGVSFLDKIMMVEIVKYEDSGCWVRKKKGNGYSEHVGELESRQTGDFLLLDHLCGGIFRNNDTCIYFF